MRTLVLNTVGGFLKKLCLLAFILRVVFRKDENTEGPGAESFLKLVPKIMRVTMLEDDLV